MKWLARSGSFVASLLVHTALLLWLLSANLAGEPPQPQPSAPIAVELVKLPPRPLPPKEEPKEPVKAKARKHEPQPERAPKLPPVEAGPPAHEISTNDDEWVAPRVNSNKGFVIGARRAPSDYSDKIQNQVLSHVDTPKDAYYKPPRNYKGDMEVLRQECVVGYEVTIDRQGNIVSLKMDPCGNDKYDAAAEKAVRDAAPYQPPPDLGADTYVIQRRIIFRKSNMH